MKKILSLITALALVVGLTACDKEAQPPQSEPENSTITPPTTNEPTPPVTGAPATPNPFNFAPLELLGYRIDDDGQVLLDTGKDYWDWVFSHEFEPDTFREYFFGTWRSENDKLSIDDTIFGHFNGNIGRVGDVIAAVYPNGGVGQTFWIDTNNPNVMYSLGDGANAGDLSRGLYYVTWEKTEDAIPEPQDNRLSLLRLHEIAYNYTIDINQLVYFEYETEDGIVFHNGSMAVNEPILLVSETPEKLVFETSVGEAFNNERINVIVTFEKINGEWVRTIVTGEPTTPKPLSLENDFIYLNITPEEADELFGELLSTDFSDGSGAGLFYRIYQNVSCTFMFGEDGEIRLINLWLLAPGYAPIRGIEVGDLLESVLSKIALDENDSITYNNEMYYYVLSDDMTFFTNTYDTYIGTTVSFNNWGDSYTVKGAMEIDFDENDEVYLIRIIVY